MDYLNVYTDYTLADLRDGYKHLVATLRHIYSNAICRP